MTSKVLPALDEMLDAKVSESIKGLINETGGLIISDGWTDVAGRPIVNALLATPAGIKFIKAVDTSGSTKDKGYIANFIIDVIHHFHAQRQDVSIVGLSKGGCTQRSAID